ncbi:hypothetical protein PLICRDRAFT_286187 [Plicaturopsis crispa FD-325 SS-3]|nr:hypothetical protein PLICRDRAFT_286187 [Plicaturopsis crispa FD-325 SS-3]
MPSTLSVDPAPGPLNSWDPSRPPSSLEPASEPSTGQIRRDPRFFFDDGNIVFKVEHTLFNLHRYILIRHVGVLRDMLSVPQPETVVEGTSADSPIELPGITSVAFKAFIQFLYTQKIEPDVQYTPQEWYFVARIAHLYVSRDVEIYAIQQLRETKTFVKLVMLGVEFSDEELRFEGYKGYSSREDCLSRDEADGLDKNEVLRLTAYRDAILQHGQSGSYPIHAQAGAAAPGKDNRRRSQLADRKALFTHCISRYY